MVKKQLSDEQVDALMRTLVNRSAADEALLNEIADSPTIWWGVQRKINEQKASKLSAWPPVNKIWRWLMVGAPVTAATALILSFFVFRPAPNNDKGVVVFAPSASSVIQTDPGSTRSNEEKNYADIKNGNFPTISDAKPSKDSTKQAMHQVAARARVVERKAAAKTTEVAVKTSKKEEIKTEFIALSYARDPESGQIVRVKVPSSMMVSLGLVTSVNTPSQMVDAEVLVGDDGLTRAIRFIR